jgi:multiple antibiotic resistance protein
MKIISISFTLFLIMNSLGLIPVILDKLKEKNSSEKRKIILREMLIALLIIFFFNFLGEFIFGWLNIPSYTIEMAGGLVLFVIAVGMIFPSDKKNYDLQDTSKPFIVPIAIPIIASPSLLSAVMVFAHQELQIHVTVFGILIAWFFTTLILMSAPIIRKLLLDKGLTACQRLMGLLLTLMAVQTFLRGLFEFISKNFFTGS